MMVNKYKEQIEWYKNDMQMDGQMTNSQNLFLITIVEQNEVIIELLKTIAQSK